MGIHISFGLQGYLYVIDFVSQMTLNIIIWYISKVDKVEWINCGLFHSNKTKKNHLTKWKYNLNVLKGKKKCNLELFLALVCSYMFPNTIFCLPLPLCSSGEEENHQRIEGGEGRREFEKKPNCHCRVALICIQQHLLLASLAIIPFTKCDWVLLRSYLLPHHFSFSTQPNNHVM
jgi:hypothetical protein